MQARDLFAEFQKLSDKERDSFLHALMVWNDFDLPGSNFIVQTKEQYVHNARCIQVQEIPELYNVAKQVCHSFGLPWTDPRTGEKFLPPKRKKEKRQLEPRFALAECMRRGAPHIWQACELGRKKKRG